MVLQTEVEWAELLKGVHREVRSLHLNRYVFRTVQEIIARNEALHGLFSKWTCAVYAVASAMAVRRLAGQSPEKADVSLLRLLNTMIADPEELWRRLDQYFPAEYSVHWDAAGQASHDNTERRVEASRRMISEDRKQLLRAAEKAVLFASKRGAHNNPTIPVDTDFDDLDEAIDTVKTLTERYLLLVLEKPHNLRNEIEPHEGWEKIFLEPWATPAILALPLGHMVPPKRREVERSDMTIISCKPPCTGTMGIDPSKPYEAIPHRFVNGELEELLTCSSCGRQEWMKASAT